MRILKRKSSLSFPLHSPDRFTVQLSVRTPLLAKIFDEHAFETRTDDPLEFQDFNALGISAETAYGNVSSLVKKAVNFYQTHLPNEISVKLNLDSSTLSC